MLLEIDESSTVPLFSQIAQQIRRHVADGSLEAGERLPPARALAASLGVNMHTVLRAYQELRDEGLVDMRRSRGVVVTGAAPDEAPILELSHRFIAEARRRGMSDPEILAYLEALL